MVFMGNSIVPADEQKGVGRPPFCQHKYKPASRGKQAANGKNTLFYMRETGAPVSFSLP
jgi:hypothetical protein